MSYRQVDETRWEWEDGATHYAVVIFHKTEKLIWSSWVERPDGPAFDDGFAQTFAQFLAGEPPPTPTPPEVTAEVRAALAPEPKKRGLFGFLRR